MLPHILTRPRTTNEPAHATAVTSAPVAGVGVAHGPEASAEVREFSLNGWVGGCLVGWLDSFN